MSRRTPIGLLLGPPVLALGIVMALSTVIWPGQATVTRHVLCDERRPDAFVVSETYETSRAPDGTGGTSTRFSMYCVSPDGLAREVGWLRPMALLVPLYLVAGAAVGAGAVAARAVGRRRADGPPEGGPVVTNAP